MGLITGLLTLPLAPVRGVTWVAERLYEQAWRELNDPAVIRRRLTEIQVAREAGTISEEDAARQEEELVRRLLPGAPPPEGREV
ncbi:gas vesicle protein GvpG [Streptomyces sp. TLI_171]|uniref:gas vesicle protein GvpG n=1 Tax=Streptomyces sp. TLI_171 TaxID=1938859 RepID=UPI000C185496|nr:gas vesicle protein GvpG [Streptomyces sp. TLI_171]RKE17530.1 gas vesicle protein GvpG [Streptomyces sp. TLI_171]